MALCRDRLLDARRREALLGWMQLAMWDAAATCLAALNDRAEIPEVRVRKSIWSLATALQRHEAVDFALQGQHSYLASILSQPAHSVKHDIDQQMNGWRELGHSLECCSMETPEDAELVPCWLVKLVQVMSGDTPKLNAAQKSSWHFLPCPWGREETWISAYALSLGFKVGFSLAPGALLPPSMCCIVFINPIRLVIRRSMYTTFPCCSFCLVYTISLTDSALECIWSRRRVA